MISSLGQRRRPRELRAVVFHEHSVPPNYCVCPFVWENEERQLRAQRLQHELGKHACPIRPTKRVFCLLPSSSLSSSFTLVPSPTKRAAQCPLVRLDRCAVWSNFCFCFLQRVNLAMFSTLILQRSGAPRSRDFAQRRYHCVCHFVRGRQEISPEIGLRATSGK